jgi:hypothetical protein
MDSQQVRNLQEAYLGVYNDLDEEYTPGPTQAEIRSRERKQRADQVAAAANQSGYGDKPSTDWKLRVTPSSILKKKSGETETVSQRMNRSHDYKNRLTGEMGRKYGSRQAAEVTRTIEGPGEPQSVTYPRKTKPSREIIRNRNRNINASYDLYDVILSHLLDEGYAETVENAEAIMVNMSEDWRDSICEANRGDEYATRGMSPEAAKTWKSERRNKTRGFSSDVEQKRKDDERYKEKFGKYPRPDPNHMGGSQWTRQANTKDNRGKRTTLIHTTNDTLSPSGIRGTVTKPEIRIGTPLGGTKNPEPKGKYLHRQQMKDAQSSDPTKRSRAPQNSLYHMN